MSEGEVRAGDNVFLLDFSPIKDKYLSSETLATISAYAELYSLTLERVKGHLPVATSELGTIVKKIEAFVKEHPNAIICYYCDYLNSIPSIRKTRLGITAQEYRSLLFTALYQRFCSYHPEYKYSQSVITIESEENYYIHVIAQARLTPQITLIEQDLRNSYGKPTER